VGGREIAARWSGVLDSFAGDVVAALSPAGQILELAPAAAERPPGALDQPPPAKHTKRGLVG